MIAIYARQSADKKDSISIETQVEACKSKVPAREAAEVFTDKGYSGKSTDRPEFQRMMTAVRGGGVSKIVVYKLDRISRSLIDFLNMREEFSRHGVGFVSCAEDFDTSTATGKLMLNVLMMFAEMERESIQKRVRDNYYARGEKGLYLGGYAPFGYEKTEIMVNGKKTYTFTENKAESQVLREIYNSYLNGSSLDAIARQLNGAGISTRKGRPWNGTCVARILRSPVYVKANADVYNYLVSLGGTMNNEIDDYTGKNGCLIYGKASDRSGAKFADLSTDYVTIGLHEGIIEPSLWLGVQNVFKRKANHSNLGTGNLTWLQGLVKCACGYTYYVKRCRTNVREHKYFYCRGKRNNSCTYSRGMIAVEKIEEIVEGEIIEYIESLRELPEVVAEDDTPEVNGLKIKLCKIESKIESLINHAADGGKIAAEYLNEAISKLHGEKKIISEKISKTQLKPNRSEEKRLNIKDLREKWYKCGLKRKRVIAAAVIEKVILDGENVIILLY